MPSVMERRLLVELLASEFDGEHTVGLSEPTREVALEHLLASGMVSRVGTWIALTRAGRELASRIADHMLGVGYSAHGRV